MTHLQTLLPRWHPRRLPLSRDQIILLFAAVNELFLGLDTYLAHVLNGTIRPREWIPILFGPFIAVVLLVAGIVAVRKRPFASLLATFALIASIAVGILGTYYHVLRGTLPSAPLGSQITVQLLIWAPPILAPFAFAFVGILGISAAWIETPVESGRLRILFGRYVQMPYSKTQAYFFIVSLGILIALVSSGLDHARHPWETTWLWAPVVSGVFGVVVAAALGVISQPTRTDLLTYVAAMLLLIIVGLIGAYFHIQADLTAQSRIVPERFLRGAPFLAPLLYTNMGLVGLAVLLDPEEEKV